MRRTGGQKGSFVAQGVLTILFTDIENSTALTQRLGDARAQEVVRTHNAIVRRALAARAGNEIKHTGDGIMATFLSATAAVSCGIAIQEATEAHNEEHPHLSFNVRIGLNAGEPVAEDEDVFGSAVQLAARVCSQAQPGQILASDVVRQLVAGKGLLFDDKGAFELKGFERPVELWEIRAEPQVGEQLWREARLQTGVAPRRRYLPLAAAAVSLAVVGGAVVAAFLLLASGGSSSSADLSELSIHLELAGPMEIVPGDCETTDIILRNSDRPLAGPIEGDAFGEGASSSFEARLLSESSCERLSVASKTVYTFSGNDTFVSTGIGYSKGSLLGVDVESVGGAAQALAAHVAYDGAGVYEGVTGSGTCETVGVRLGGDLDTPGTVGAESSTDCVFRLAAASALGPLILANVADERTVTTRGGAAGMQDTIKIGIVYHNNAGEPLQGLTLRVPLPANAELAAAGEGGTVTGDSVAWTLPDLEPDSVATLEVRLRLLSAQADEVTLTPEIDGNGFADPVRGDPIVLRIVR